MIEFVLSSRKPYKKTETDFVALKTQAIQANRKLKKKITGNGNNCVSIAKKMTQYLKAEMMKKTK
jgi:hypothetical protein